MSTIYTVQELTANISSRLEKNFPFVWVRGEISNLARPSSGHLYFSLKDSNALLQCVWFKNAQRKEEKFDPLTGEVFEHGPRPSMSQILDNGMQVLCAGSVSVYAPRGTYQLIISLIQDGGCGALHLAFEKLKKKLFALGYFDDERKRAIPLNPKRVAVITAPKGAAIHDFLRIAKTRGLSSEIRIMPVPVQGDLAAAAIVKAMHDVSKWADVIVLIRGGGSLEDLWAFNEEILAEAIFRSTIPILAGIGHEVDISIADMTADVRAATPSHAAQLLWREREEYMQKIDGLEWSVHKASKTLFQKINLNLKQLEQALKWLSPLQRYKKHEELLDQYHQRLQLNMTQTLDFKIRHLKYLEQKLPIAMHIHEVAKVKLDACQLRLNHALRQNLSLKEQNFSNLTPSLFKSFNNYVTFKHNILHALSIKLKACGPLQRHRRYEELLQQYAQRLQWNISKVLEFKGRNLAYLEQKLPMILHTHAVAKSKLDACQLRLNHALRQNLSLKEQIYINLRPNLIKNFQSLTTFKDNTLHRLSIKLKAYDPLHKYKRCEELLDQYYKRLQWHVAQIFEFKIRNLEYLEQKLPKDLRFYEDGQTKLDAWQLRLDRAMQQNIYIKEQNFKHLTPNLIKNYKSLTVLKDNILQTLTIQLQVYDPLMPLSKGYALIQKEDGQVIRSVDDIQQGQYVHMQVADGYINAIVQEKSKNKL